MQKGFAPIIFILGGLLLGLVLGGVYFYQSRFQAKPVNSFEECVKIGNPVLESYPRQCKSNGKSFTEELSEEEKKKLVPPQDGQICAQVITPAKNLKTSECKEFPTPCDVPEGWEKVESCLDTSREPTGSAETANWKIYQNEIRFKYPENWVEEQNETPNSSAFMSPDRNYSLGFATRKNYNNLIKKPYSSLEEFASHYPDLKGFIPITIASQPAGKQNAYQFDNDGNGGWIYEMFVFSKDKKSIYQLRLVVTNKITSDIKDREQLFDQILSTFKFLE